jgi:hypothetical protein
LSTLRTALSICSLTVMAGMAAHGKRSHDRHAHHGRVQPAPPPLSGLCASCIHARLVRGARTTFMRCAHADDDPRFPRYPSLPVLGCDGYEMVSPQATRR